MDAVTVEEDTESTTSVAEEAESGTSVAEAKAQVRDRGDRIRDRECERALRRLDDRTDLSERERRVVRDLAAQLTDSLLAVPEAGLERAGESDERETARVALALFGDD
jgi:glutamyl-tRNA reductase